MIDKKYQLGLEGMRIFTSMVECEVCPLTNLCEDLNVTICDMLIDEMYEIEYKINMEG